MESLNERLTEASQYDGMGTPLVALKPEEAAWLLELLGDADASFDGYEERSIRGDG